jgi:hypothetical protein
LLLTPTSNKVTLLTVFKKGPQFTFYIVALLYLFTQTMSSFVLSKDISGADYDALFVIDMNAFQNAREVLAFSPGKLPLEHRVTHVARFQRGVFEGPTEHLYAKIAEIKSSEITPFISARVYREPKGLLGESEGNSPITLP